MRLLTTAEVAERLGVHRTRVHVLIKSGRLPAERYGKVYLVDERSLALVAERSPGRPPKQPTEQKAAPQAARKARQTAKR